MTGATVSRLARGTRLAATANRLLRPLLRGGRFLPAAVAISTAVAAARAMRPPRAAGTEAPADCFSAGRAADHLREIAAEPRPVGSPANDRVREWLVSHMRDLGLEVEVQVGAAAVDLGPAPYGVRYRAGGRVHNIVARLPGTQQGPALLLMTHYDSVEHSPGVSDAGMLIAAVLETLRALRTGPPLRNDLIVVLTDGEEAGLLGARAFFNDHPAAARAAAVLNFESRGTSGPALMFETGPRSGPLVRRLALTPHRAFASSLFDEAYRRMPNTTDFTLAKERGLPGLNFANIGGFIHYHGPGDDFSHLDPGTLQHQGENMLSLVRGLGQADLNSLDGPDEVYFSLGRGWLVHYPARAALPLALVGASAAAAALLGRRTPEGGRWITGRAVAAQSARLLAGPALSTGLTWVLGHRSPHFRRSGDFHRTDEVYAAMIGVAASLALVGDATSAGGPWQRLGATLPPLAVSSVLLSVAMPGGSYLTTWPLLGGTVGVLAGSGHPTVARLGAATAAASGMMLLSPLSRLLYEGLTPRLAAAPALAWQLCAEIAAPALWTLPPRARALVVALGTATAAGVVAYRLARPAGGATPPETLSYLLDTDTKEALFASSDAAPSAWTRRWLGDAPRRGRLPLFFPGWERDFLYATADPVDLPAPAAEILADVPSRVGRRQVRLRVVSKRGARQISVAVPRGAVHTWSLEGRSTAASAGRADDRPWELWIYAPGPSGVEVDLELDEAPVWVRLMDRTDGLTVGTAEDEPGPGHPAAALDIDAWGNGTFVVTWLRL